MHLREIEDARFTLNTGLDVRLLQNVPIGARGYDSALHRVASNGDHVIARSHLCCPQLGQISYAAVSVVYVNLLPSLSRLPLGIRSGHPRRLSPESRHLWGSRLMSALCQNQTRTPQRHDQPQVSCTATQARTGSSARCVTSPTR
jgi:hypothetical protein